MINVKILRLTAAMICPMMAGCNVSDVNTAFLSSETQELINVSDYSMHYPTGEATPEEYPPQEVTIMLMTCGREASELIAATVEICKENGIDYTELSPAGAVQYSTDYTYTIYPLQFDVGRLNIGLERHVREGVLYSIEYEN